MLLPKRVKYRRVHRGRMTGKALRGNKVTYGDFGLQATEPAWITSNHRSLILGSHLQSRDSFYYQNQSYVQLKFSNR